MTRHETTARLCGPLEGTVVARPVGPPVVKVKVAVAVAVKAGATACALRRAISSPTTKFVV